VRAAGGTGKEGFIFRIAEGRHSNGRTSAESLNGESLRSFPMANRTGQQSPLPRKRRDAPSTRSEIVHRFHGAYCNLCRVEMSKWPAVPSNFIPLVTS